MGVAMASQLSHPSEKALHPSQTDAPLTPPNLDEFRSLPRGALVFPLSGEGKGLGLSCGCCPCVVACRMQTWTTSQFTTTVSSTPPPHAAPQPINFARFRQGGMPMPRCVRPRRAPRPGQEQDAIPNSPSLHLRCCTCWVLVVVSH